MSKDAVGPDDPSSGAGLPGLEVPYGAESRTYYARPATDEEATAQARERLSVMLDGLSALGAPDQAQRRFGLPITTIITSY